MERPLAMPPTVSTKVSFYATKEYFPVDSFGVYDIQRAKQIIVEHPRPTWPVEVGDWISFGERMNLLPALDAETHGADYSFPVIIATVDKTLGHYLIIDGWHRLAKANQDGLSRMQGFYLTEEETKEIFQAPELLGCGSFGIPRGN